MANLIKYFSKIKGLIGNKIYVLMGLTMLVVLVEGIGIALFFPILQNGFGEDKLSRILKAGFDILHIPFSLSLLLGLIIVFFVLRAVFLIAYARYSGKMTSNLLVTLRRKMIHAIFGADYVYILKKEAGYVNNVIFREISFVIEAFTTFTYIFNYSLYALVYIILSLLVSYQITAVILLLSPLVIILMKRLNELTRKASRELSESHGRFSSIMIQVLNKIKYLKSTHSYDKVFKLVDKENETVGRFTYKMAFLAALTKELFEPVAIFMVVGLLFYHVVFLKRSVNEIMFLAILFLQVIRQLLNAQSTYRKFLSSIGSIEIFNNIERGLEENREDMNLNGLLPDFDREISIRNVTVVFPNGKKALDGINVTIKPRCTVAFVGHSGSGKSTIANLITGIIKPTKGGLLFGGIDYNKVNLKYLRESIGYVTQEDIIFNASIRDNISLWDENLSADRLKKVMKMSYMDDFVNGVAARENAVLGDNGLDISGGQRQRVTIARELYKNSKLLILDEATSALDSKFEKEIYDNLKELKGQKTMVVIAHRLSTIKNADYIYVLDDGKIVEEGTFDGLHKNKDTKFCQLYQLQSITNQ